MDSARKVASQSELRTIAAAGEGFIADPFNRCWHVASCPRILEMTVGQPKWFAPTRDSLDDYLKQRLAQYPTANPLRACKTCVGYGNPLSAASKPRSLAVGTAASETSMRPPYVERTDRGFQIWADERVRNESKAASTAGALRQRITREIRALPGPAGRILRASYAGTRPRSTDVENLLFNNIDQTFALFRASGERGVSFEDLGLAVPVAPDGTTRSSFYRYQLEHADAPYVTIATDQLLCRVPEVAVPDGPARLAARIWLAVRRARPTESDGPSVYHGEYVLRIDVRGLNVATSVKALVDGASAAMQRDDPERVGDALVRMSALLGVGEAELVTLVTAPNAPLGARTRSTAKSKESLFALDGTNQVRVTPDDDRCAAAQVLAHTDGHVPQVTVEVYSAARR